MKYAIIILGFNAVVIFSAIVIYAFQRQDLSKPQPRRYRWYSDAKKKSRFTPEGLLRQIELEQMTR